ncbi:asparagine synthase-related protein [Burkholderia gladioli]|uniref:asparagine synthase-related protein n=1 Tax=Burkholderia gladioli TaxID=28095 RepID=UPI00163EF7C4|nr:asparagine synthase-related protein [Burkholderia gladioli]
MTRFAIFIELTDWATGSTPGNYHSILDNDARIIHSTLNSQVLIDGDTPYIKAKDGDILILGELFKNSHGRIKRLTNLSSEEVDEIIKTKGRCVTSNYFGSYVLLINSKLCSERIVLRDPLGGIPVYYHKNSERVVLFSDLKFAQKGLPKKLTLDREYIGRYLFSVREMSNDTGFSEIKRLSGGESLTINSNQISSNQYWNPCDFARRPWRFDQVETESHLKNAAVDTIVSQVNDDDRIMLRLSGGFDSSLIGAVVAKYVSPLKIIGYNYYLKKSRASDERKYAEILCQENGINLEYRELDPFRFNILDAKQYLESPVPSALYIAGSSWRDSIDVAQRHGCNCIWDGHGGDQVFYAYQFNHIINDYIRANGVTRNLPDIINNAAKLSNRTIPLAIRDAWQNRNNRGMSFIKNDLAMDKKNWASDKVMQSWNNGGKIRIPFESEDIPLGKAVQIFGILWRQLWNFPIANAKIPLRHPIINQQLVELCLQIPSYMHAAGGESRGAIRAATKGIVPQAITNRFWKGTTELPTIGWFHSPAVQSYLLDGILVDFGFIDRGRLKEIFAEAQPFRVKQQILETLQLEIWLKSVCTWY